MINTRHHSYRVVDVPGVLTELQKGHSHEVHGGARPAGPGGQARQSRRRTSEKGAVAVTSVDSQGDAGSNERQEGCVEMMPGSGERGSQQ